MTAKLQFKKICLKCPQFDRFIFERGVQTQYWDDGFLHVKRHGLRAIFKVCDDENSHAQADLVRKILGKLKIAETDECFPDFYSDEPPK